MPGLLDGQISKAVYGGFRGKLKKAVLRRVAAAQSGGLDGRGDPIYPVPTRYPGLQGYRDRYSAFYMAQAGIPKTDVKVCIFAESVPAAARPLAKDDQIMLGTEWFQVRTTDIDPAGALWECQAFAIAAPGDP